ncbi:trypsin-like peptidase domain-containing protein [Pseudoalteromonas sp. MMG013]|uniref:S1 family peptidase n=1 Tax=Pseudoalteromonas sp. MMG013 TaxID=2822687 RepID=UPI001B37DB0F|nr:serine protease [Pseudoalteromonas sp. MMG013]MBQ4864178.1 trypsin-like peptidase domain-containing protein [Pseudoalteromonas sp. MMG013]
MRFIFTLLVVVLLVGCEATPINNAANIKTKQKLNSNLSLPIALPIAFHVDRTVPEKKVNFIGKLEEAAQLVTSDFFISSEKLNSTTKFAYLVKLKAISDWDYAWGGWNSNFHMTMLDHEGNIIFQKNIKANASGTGGLYDFNAVYNAFAKATKELLIEFLNQNYAQIDKYVSSQSSILKARKPIKTFFHDLKPINSGTGFYINKSGELITAAHVIDECIYYETQFKGQRFDAELVSKSNLLDVAVLKTKHNNSHSATFNVEDQISLGKQVFTTGYPLAGILADYPSLTMGNISSLGGLKGAQGYFQYSIPIQPGNSGGAIIDFKGNLAGMVTSSLNQVMMLKNSGTTSQNVNFGIRANLLKRYLNKNNVTYEVSENSAQFEKASADATEYSTQVLCYK